LTLPFDYAQGDGQSGRSRELHVDVSSLASGIYFVKVFAKNGTAAAKFVKQ
ncbi:MAG: T9SS type A sorting domain-containing protein, partial [Bacteroidia bacterium]|nr:T9SS type A sorting domain-containing protein [Bacteroidia bacterium]